MIGRHNLNGRYVSVLALNGSSGFSCVEAGMNRLKFRKTSGYTFYLTCLVAMTIALLFVGYRFAENFYVTSDIEASARRAAPYLTSLISVMERYQNLPTILSEDKEIIEAAKGSPSPDLNKRLARFAHTTRAEAVYLMDVNGWTIATSNWDSPKSFLGKNYGFRPYFRDSLSGRSGEFFAIGATTGRPGYFISHPVKNSEEKVIGVIAVKVNLRGLEANWQNPEERIFIVNADRVIVLSGQHSWRYNTIGELDSSTRANIAARRQFGNEPLEPLELKRDGHVITIDKVRFVEHTVDVGRLGWKLKFLSPYKRVQERSRLIMAITAVALSLLLAFFLFLRSERIRGLLISSQKERDILNRLNQDLAREVEERIQAEERLKMAQKELRQTSKLAVLGQLAASVSHELGQPLSAMKTYIAGARLSGAGPNANVSIDESETDQLLGQLDRLTDRMSETTRQLRFFARRGGEGFDDVNLADVIAGALETMRPAIKSEGARLQCQNVTKHVLVRGGRMRLEQVLVNLIRNALDAMRSTSKKEISLEMKTDLVCTKIIVRDTGEGLTSGEEARIFEPLVTTKASGEGLGLGLAISASIVKEHGGMLSARNREAGGAEFILELPIPIGAGDADS